MAKSRKHVAAEAAYGDVPCREQGQVCRVRSNPGSNLVLVDTPEEGEQAFLRMPKKFRKLMWVRAGVFVMAQLDTDGGKGGDVVAVLMDDQVKALRADGAWPARFAAVNDEEDHAGDGGGGGGGGGGDDDDDDDDDLPPLVANSNRRKGDLVAYSDDSDDESDDE